MKNLILASASPRRKFYLKKLGISFKSVSADLKENTHFIRPHSIVKDLAFQKAAAIAEKYPNNIVVGADTLVVCKGHILGKPKNKKQALQILKLENGSWQKVYTGLAVICKNKNIVLTGYEISRCKARKFSLKQLETFADKHLDKAGGYAVQDKDDPFIEKIRGSYDNVVGFPVKLFLTMLKRATHKFDKI